MNDLLEAKLTITRIKTQLLDLASELFADDLQIRITQSKRLLAVVDYIDEHDVKVGDIITNTK